MKISNTYTFSMSKNEFKNFLTRVKVIKSIKIIKGKNEKQQLFALENKKDPPFADWNKKIYKVPTKYFDIDGNFYNVVFRSYFSKKYKKYYVMTEDCLGIPFPDLALILTLLNRYGVCITEK